MNPLGVRAMYLGASMYRIHGTDAPWTIGQAVSKGCIRMLNDDVLDLYPRVPVGTKVTVTWQRFSSQAIASGEESGPSFSPATSPVSYKGPVRTVRSLTPAASVETISATTEEPALDPNADEATLAAAAEKPIEQPKPVKKTEAHKKPAAEHASAQPVAAPEMVKHEAVKQDTTAHDTAAHDAASAAEKAAAAASKAAESARAAAEAAKKAAEDAKRATSGEAGKSALALRPDGNHRTSKRAAQSCPFSCLHGRRRANLARQPGSLS